MMILEHRPKQERALQFLQLIEALGAPPGYPVTSDEAYSLALAEAIAFSDPQFTLAEILALAQQLENRVGFGSDACFLNMEGLQKACGGNATVARMVAGLAGFFADDQQNKIVDGRAATVEIDCSDLNIFTAIAPLPEHEQPSPVEPTQPPVYRVSEGDFTFYGPDNTTPVVDHQLPCYVFGRTKDIIEINDLDDMVEYLLPLSFRAGFEGRNELKSFLEVKFSPRPVLVERKEAA